MSRCSRRTAATAVLTALLVVLAGCSGGSAAPPRAGRPTGAAAPSSPTPPAVPRVYVAVGASETVGVGADHPETDAWPRVLHDTALPDTRFVDVGVSGATVRDAL